MASLPSLVVNLALNSVEFVSGLTKIEYQAKKTTEEIRRGFANISSTVDKVAATLGISIGVGAFVHLIRSTIEAQDHLENLSKSTGITVEQLGGLGFAASKTGGNLDDMASSFKKFSVNASAAAAGGKEQLEVFNALGISLKDLRTLTPDQLFVKAATAFAGFSEGVDKSALASAAFGKSYQGIIPTLDQGGKKLQENIDYFNRFGGVTSETAARASEFSGELKKAELLTSAFGKAVTADLLPPMRVLIQAFIDAKEKGDQFHSSAQTIANLVTNVAVGVLYVAQAFDRVGGAIGVTIAKFDALLHGNFAQFQIISDERRADLEKDAAAFDKLVNAIRNAQQYKNLDTGPPEPSKTTPAPRLTPKGSGKDDPAKAFLEGQIKALEANVAAEKDLLEARQFFLSAYYQQGYTSVADYYTRVQESRDEALRNTIVYYEKEIAAAEAYQKHEQAIGNKKGVQEAQNKIDEIRVKEAKANLDAINDSNKLSIARTQDTEKYGDQLQELNAKVLELTGNLSKAALIRFDIENRVLSRQTANDPVSTARIAVLREQADAQAKLNEQERAYNLILGQVGVAQGYIDLKVRAGYISETQGLVETSNLNKSKLVELQAIAAAYAEIAARSKDPADLLKAQQMKLAVDQLAASTDLLADKFNKTFGDAFSSAFSDFISGTKTAKEAFNDFVKSVTKSISDIASQNIATALFGKGGGLSGIGDVFSKIFGGGAKGIATGAAETATQKAAETATQKTVEAATQSLSSATALASSGVTLESAGFGLNSAATALSAAAELLSAAAATSSGGEAASGLGGIFGKLFSSGGSAPEVPYWGAAASGTDFARGGLTLVGERGPEFVNLPRGSQVFPNGTKPSGQRPNLSIVVNVPQGTSGPSADQIGIRVGAHVQRALNRNG